MFDIRDLDASTGKRKGEAAHIITSSRWHGLRVQLHEACYDVGEKRGGRLNSATTHGLADSILEHGTDEMIGLTQI